MKLEWLTELQPPIRRNELSPTAQRGLVLARTLDQHYQGMHGYGIRQLAGYHRVHSGTIRRWINTAARQLQHDPGRCEACGKPFPLGARRSRRYCDQHATSLARVRRHRNRARTQPPHHRLDAPAA